MSEIYVGLGEVVKTVGRKRRVVRYSVGVSERFFGKLNTLGLGSAEYVSAEIAVTKRDRPSLPVVVGMSRNHAVARAEGGVYLVVALLDTV